LHPPGFDLAQDENGSIGPGRDSSLNERQLIIVIAEPSVYVPRHDPNVGGSSHQILRRDFTR
ncbi:MAG: hypothetical protein ACJAYU_004829, partial [Bradymonadia bacterium]